uniref:Uncharacterized protein n=1 Tax=Lepisosteus oculatus TaxID=7918 RepID=W5MD00_LEPOC
PTNTAKPYKRIRTENSEEIQQRAIVSFQKNYQTFSMALTHDCFQQRLNNLKALTVYIGRRNTKTQFLTTNP